MTSSRSKRWYLGSFFLLSRQSPITSSAALTVNNNMNHNMISKKLDSPSAQRNKEVIWGILSSQLLPLLSQRRRVSVLEIAAGSGVHTDYFSTQFAAAVAASAAENTATDGSPSLPSSLLKWYPTDPDPESLDSIRCYIQEGQLNEVAGVQAPLPLTLNAEGIAEPETASALLFQQQQQPRLFNLILCINMIHISPWEATLGLFKLAKEQLVLDGENGGILFCYGPYKENGTAVESNM
jgi:Protein of unknown function (DUF938)